MSVSQDINLASMSVTSSNTFYNTNRIYYTTNKTFYNTNRIYYTMFRTYYVIIEHFM